MYPANLMTCSLVLLAVFAAYQSIFHRSPYIDQKVAGATKVSPDWVEIKPDNLLKPTGDANVVCLDLAEPFHRGLRLSDGVQMPDGSTVTPEVEIIDTEGNVLPLSLLGARGEMKLMYIVSAKQPRSDSQTRKEFRGIRIRADKEIQLAGVYWTGIVNKRMN